MGSQLCYKVGKSGGFCKRVAKFRFYPLANDSLLDIGLDLELVDTALSLQCYRFV